MPVRRLDTPGVSAAATVLFDFAIRPEFVTRFSWAPGSIACWDNRQVWHFAVNDYQGQRRIMNRILLAGTSPAPA